MGKYAVPLFCFLLTGCGLIPIQSSTHSEIPSSPDRNLLPTQMINPASAAEKQKKSMAKDEQTEKEPMEKKSTEPDPSHQKGESSTKNQSKQGSDKPISEEEDQEPPKSEEPPKPEQPPKPGPEPSPEEPEEDPKLKEAKRIAAETKNTEQQVQVDEGNVYKESNPQSEVLLTIKRGQNFYVSDTWVNEDNYMVWCYVQGTVPETEEEPSKEFTGWVSYQLIDPSYQPSS